MEKNFTDVEYWEKYYKGTAFNRKHITDVCSVYDKFFDKWIESAQIKCKNFIEIGGYPGRYLAYIADKYKLKPYSLDFNSDATKIQSAFAQMGVTDYEIYREDINKFVAPQKYDLVFSNGFIEHFANFDEILDKHVEMVSDGGTMLIMVPNKRNFRKIYGLLFDYKNLKSHNLKALKKSVFTDFVKRNNLEMIDFSYFGGFPYSVHQKPNMLQKGFVQFFRMFFKKVNPYLAKHPNKYTCSLLICIARKPLKNN